MDVAGLRDRTRREVRLDEDWFHLFALADMIRTLRAESAYASSGHSGLLLLKNEHLRVVLEIARKGVAIGEHTVRGPTVVQVLDGSLELRSDGETRIAHAGEMAVVPDARPRTLTAKEDCAFLRVLSLAVRSDDRAG